MKTAYLDCASGISGDMMLGALVDAGADFAAIAAAIDSLNLPGCRLVATEVKKKGFRAKQITVETVPEQKHRHLHHIQAIIEQGRLSARQKDLAQRIFRRLAEAEAKVHGSTIEKVHFHEVGAVDSIADIVGTAVGWDLLGIQRAVASPIPTGTGKIRIAHGECSIPAPATAELLAGVPLAESTIPFELTTPTGAAIVSTLVGAFGPVPAMRIRSIGYGAGQRDLEQQPNLLRLMVGDAVDEPIRHRAWMMEVNLDDISGEVVGYCTTQLLEAGALDVYTTPIQMKKNRPAVTLAVLCEENLVPVVESLLFRETTTLGVRRWPVERSVLKRQAHEVDTPWGRVLGKIAWVDGQPRFSPEFEACRQIATQHRVPLQIVYETSQKAFDVNTLARPAE